MRSRFVLLLAAATASCLVLAGIAVATSRDATTGPTDGSSLALGTPGSLPVITGSPSDIARTVASGLPALSQISLTGTSLDITADAPSMAKGDLVRADWEATVFAGALADALTAAGLPLPHEVHDTVVDPAGEQQQMGAGIGNAARDRAFPAIDMASFSAGVTRGASALGIDQVRVSALTVYPGDTIPVISAVAKDPAAVVAQFVRPEAWSELLGVDYNDLAGYYIELRDESSGDVVFASGSSARDAAGEGWVLQSIAPAGWKRT
jgi:hypothetical protein